LPYSPSGFIKLPKCNRIRPTAAGAWRAMASSLSVSAYRPTCVHAWSMLNGNILVQRGLVRQIAHLVVTSILSVGLYSLSGVLSVLLTIRHLLNSCPCRPVTWLAAGSKSFFSSCLLTYSGAASRLASGPRRLVTVTARRHQPNATEICRRNSASKHLDLGM
jgi:hypothetical protein